MSRFSQFAGPIGPMPNVPARLHFSPVNNPWVNRVAGFQGAPGGNALVAPRVASATIAGRPSIGCCGQCAAEHRS